MTNNIDDKFPLIDLHRHLDGNVRLSTILELGRKYNLALPALDVEGLKPHVQVNIPQPGVMAFIEKFHWMRAVLVTYEDCARIAYENVEDAGNEGLDYLELRFSPIFMAEKNHLDPAGIVAAVCDGVDRGKKDFNLPVNLIGILSRTYGSETAWSELEALLTERDRIVALDLAGDEVNYPGELFTDHFRRAREVGWRITVHAGEISGPESVWQALLGLNAARIGHGVRALEDSELLDYLAEKRIGIECNLTSNVQTSTVLDYQDHPISAFLEHNLYATINTDDPGISAIDLPYEYNVAAPAAGLNPDQIRKAQRNALEVAFLSNSQKKVLLDQKSVSKVASDKKCYT